MRTRRPVFIRGTRDCRSFHGTWLPSFFPFSGSLMNNSLEIHTSILAWLEWNAATYTRIPKLQDWDHSIRLAYHQQHRRRRRRRRRSHLLPRNEEDLSCFLLSNTPNFLPSKHSTVIYVVRVPCFSNFVDYTNPVLVLAVVERRSIRIRTKRGCKNLGKG